MKGKEYLAGQKDQGNTDTHHVEVTTVETLLGMDTGICTSHLQQLSVPVWSLHLRTAQLWWDSALYRQQGRFLLSQRTCTSFPTSGEATGFNPWQMFIIYCLTLENSGQRIFFCLILANLMVRRR